MATTTAALPVLLDKVSELERQLAARDETIVTLSQALEERSLARTRLRQAGRLQTIERLAVGIANELNTPAQFVGDNVAFLQRAFDKLWRLLEAQAVVLDQVRSTHPTAQDWEQVDSARAAAKLDYLGRQVPRAIQQSLAGLGDMTAVVKAMKALSRASARAEPTDLHELIELTASLAKGEWRYVAELELDFDWSLPTLALRQAELAHVLLDMIANAAHAIAGSQAAASADKGKIVIKTKSLGEQLEISVTDTAGSGPDPLRTRSFEPFFAGDANEGSATGLEFAEAAVRAHGGALRLEADADRFSYVISLPLSGS